MERVDFTLGCSAILLSCALAFAEPLKGQTPSSPDHRGDRLVSIAASFGFGGVSQGSRCISNAYVVPGLELVTRGSLFFSVGAEALLNFGVRESCLLLPRASTLPDGRVHVEGDDRFDVEKAGHYALGLGMRIRDDAFSIEPKVEVGMLRGQDDFPAEWMRSLTAATGIVAGDHFVISFELRWLRTPHWEKDFSADVWSANPQSSKPEGAVTGWTWKRLRSVSFGYRF